MQHKLYFTFFPIRPHKHILYHNMVKQINLVCLPQTLYLNLHEMENIPNIFQMFFHFLHVLVLSKAPQPFPEQSRIVSK